MYQNTKSHSINSNHHQLDWDEPTTALTYLTKYSQSNGMKKMPCRYGIGCTHIHDSLHLERFTHPPIPVLDHEMIRSSYLCAECGLAFPSLVELRDHLVRKTAWSNSSLVGCRISCLLDNKEWHEGLVTQYHKSGKHSVEFRMIGEKRWLSMSKMAFYIIDRNIDQPIEYKENEDSIYRSNVQIDHSETESWSYSEDISIEFAFAQSVLFKVYGGVVQETGHKTKGHLSLTDRDREVAKSMKGSLLYGELLARGANKALGPHHLDAASCSVLYDLGMGTGKVLIQAFLQFRNLTYLFGVELSHGRYLIAEEAVMKMITLLGRESFDIEVVPGSSIKVTERLGETENSVKRVLHLVCGNMFHLRDIDQADIIMLETEIPQDLHGDLCKLLSKMKDGAQTLTYHDIRKIWTLGAFPFKQLEVNRYLSDRYPTSWSVQRGHHFFLWRKIILTCSNDEGPRVSSKSSSEIINETRKDPLAPTFHDNRAPATPIQSQRSPTVSIGCFELSFTSSILNFFRRRRSINEHESDKVIPVRESGVSKASNQLEISRSKTDPLISSSQGKIASSLRSSMQPTLLAHNPSDVGGYPAKHAPLTDNLVKSSVVQPLPDSTLFLYGQQFNRSASLTRLPLDQSFVRPGCLEDTPFDPVIHQLKCRMKSH